MTCTPSNFFQSPDEQGIMKWWLTYQPAKQDRHDKETFTLTIPLLGALDERRKAFMHAHKQAYNLRHQKTPLDRTPLALNDKTGTPYARVSHETGVSWHTKFTERWNQYRAVAGLICPSLIGEGLDRHGNQILAYRAQDNRDTAVTRLSRDLTDIQLSAWHGSSPTVLASIRRAYIEISPELANTGAEKIVARAKLAGIIT